MTCPGTHNCKQPCSGWIYSCKAAMSAVEQLSQETDIGIRLARVLYRDNITTAKQLLEASSVRLMSLRGIGSQGMAKLELWRYGR